MRIRKSGLKQLVESVLTEQASFQTDGWAIKQVSDKEWLATGGVGKLQIEAKLVEVDGYRVGRKRIKPEIHVEAALIHGSERILFWREEFENNRPGRPLTEKDFPWLLGGVTWAVIRPIVRSGGIK